MNRDKLDTFTRAYLECALWSSNDDNDEPLDSNYDIDDIAFLSLEDMIEDCRLFQADTKHLIKGHETIAGHDFWLTRNGHGAGFWDGDWPEPAASILTELAQSFGECYILVDHDANRDEEGCLVLS